MGVQLTVVALRQARALAHQGLRDRERRTGRERDAYVRAGLRVMEQLQHPLAVGENRVLVLDDAVGRQAAVLDREVHRAARHRHPDAESPRLLDLDVDRVLEPGGIKVMVVRRGRAARHEEFGQRQPRREPQMIRLQPGPDRIERNEPGKERLVDRRRVGAGQRLVEMVVGVDEARQHDMAGGVEHSVDPRWRLALADKARDPGPLDDEPTLRAGGQYRQRVLDPGPYQAGSSILLVGPSAVSTLASRPRKIAILARPVSPEPASRLRRKRAIWSSCEASRRPSLGVWPCTTK